MAEKHIERKLKAQIEALGGLFLKWISPGFTGVPDRIGLLPGELFCFVETKTRTGRLSERQKFVHKQLRDLGFSVWVVWDETDLDSFIFGVKLKLRDNDL